MDYKENVPDIENETVINYSRGGIGPWAEMYTTDKSVMKRYEKFSKEHPEYATLIREDKYSMTFSVHPKCASLYPRAPRHLVLSDEERAIRAARLRAALSK